MSVDEIARQVQRETGWPLARCLDWAQRYFPNGLPAEAA